MWAALIALTFATCPASHAQNGDLGHISATAASGVNVTGNFAISPIGGSTITYSVTATPSMPTKNGYSSKDFDYPIFWIQAFNVTTQRVVADTWGGTDLLPVVYGSMQGGVGLSGVHLGDTIQVNVAAEIDECGAPSILGFVQFSATTFKQFTYTITTDPAYWQKLGRPRSVTSQPKTLVAEPVSVTSGAFYENDVDLHVNGPLPIEIRRTYSSSGAEVMNEFGFGWLSGYSSYLVPSADLSTIQGSDADGSVIVFRRQGSGGIWTPTPADNPDLTNSSGGSQNPFNATITQPSPGSFRWLSGDGSVRNYVVHQYPVTSAGLSISREKPYLTSWQDNRGNTLSFSYGTNPGGNDYGRINLVQSSNGTSVALIYDPEGHIIVATASDGRSVNYSYDFAGDLVSVQLPDGGTFGYAYSGNSHLLTEKDQPGGRILQNYYDDSGRVIRQLATVDAADPTTPVTTATFDYSVPGQTTMKDAYGNPTVYQYTSTGLITNITDPLGQSTTQTWYSTTGAGAYVNSLRSMTDKRGLVTTYQYDSQGNPTQIQVTGDLTGNQTMTDTSTTTAVFNSINLPVTMTDAAGITTAYAYSDPNYPYLPTQISTSKDGTPLRTDTYTYVAVGDATVYSKGLLATRTVAAGSPDQAAARYEYSAAGYMTKQTSVTGTTDPDVVAIKDYNARGEVTAITDGDGRKVVFTYDGMSRPTSTVVQDENGTTLGTSTMTYTPTGELSQTVGQRTSPADSVQRSYDAAGRLEEEDVALSQAKTDGSGVTAAQSLAITSYAYDLSGNLVLTVDPLNNVNTMTYDAIGQVLSKNTAGLRAEAFQYEPGGKVAQYTNPLGGVVKTYYTTTGQPRRQENPDGSVLQWRYYTDGRLQQEILRNGATWTAVYDDVAHTVTRTLTNSTGTVLATEVSVFDLRGNLIRHTDPEGFTKTATYDGLNRVKSATGPGAVAGSAQQTTTTIYGASAKVITALNGFGEQVVTISDGLGRPQRSQILDASNGVVRTTSYAYSDDHNAVTVTEGTGAGAISRTTYTDTLGRAVLTVLGDGTFNRTTYDLDGNVLSTTDALGQTSAYAYNGLNQMVAQTLPDGAVTRFTYDAMGNLLTRVLPDGTLTQAQTFDNAGRKTAEQLYSGSTVTRQYSYAYYAAGSPAVGLLQTATTPRETVTKTYDEFLRPQTITTVGALAEVNGTTTYTYDRRSLVTAIDQTSVNHAAGPDSRISRTYDGYGQLLTENVTAGGTSFAHVTQAWDAAGRRASLDESSSSLPAPLFGYQYRADGRLTQVAANGQDYNFNYADSGLTTTRVNPFRTQAMNLRDAVGRLQEQTQTVGGTDALVEDMIWRGNSTLSSYTATRSGSGAWNETRLFDYNARGQLLKEGFMPATNVANALNYTFDGASPGLGVRLDARIGTGAPASWETAATADALGRVIADQSTAPAGHSVPVTGLAQGADHVDIVIDGVAQGRAAYSASGGAWSINVNLAAGSHTLTANAVDPSGLFTAAATSTFTVTSANPAEQTGAVTSAFDNDGNVVSRSWSSGITQTLAWDAFGRLIKVSQRTGGGSGYDWTAIYDGLGRRIQASQQTVAAGAATGTPTVITSIYDPGVEFLEIGVAVNGAKAWKVYGPDLNGRYGGLQGTGGLEATIVDASKETKGVLNDQFGNGVASVTSGGTVSWFATRVGGYGPLPGSAAETLTDITRLAEATAWRSRRIDPTGFYNLGARYYEPVGGRFLSADPMGQAASPSLYDYAGGDPINGLDPDGRCTDNETAHYAGFPSSTRFPNYIVRKEYPWKVNDALENGSPEIDNGVSLADTALNQGRGYYPASETPGGAPNINGRPLMLDAEKIEDAGGNIYSRDEIVADMRKQGIPEARIQMYLQNQARGEGEVLIDAVPPSAVNTGTMVAMTRGTQALAIVGAAQTGWNLGQSINESMDQGTPMPFVKQTVREAGGWGGAWAGFQVGIAGGAMLGIETGPGAIVTGLIGGIAGGYAGYRGADWVIKKSGG